MKVRAFIEALEAIAAEKGDDTPVYVPDTGCGCCSGGPGLADKPEFLPAVENHWDGPLPGRIYITEDY